MAKKRDDAKAGARKGRKKDLASWKPGSEIEKAKEVGSEEDFGVPAGREPSADRDYVSTNTKMSDPGAAKPYAWEHDGVRDHGAGARDEGPGSGTEGDVDVDIIGVGTNGRVVAETGPGDPPGADDVGRAEKGFETPPPARQGDAVVEPARGENQRDVGVPIVMAGPLVGTAIDPSDAVNGPPARGADAATNPEVEAQIDDSFVEEISRGEAMGQDNALPPSSDSQGLAEEEDDESGDDDEELRGLE